MKISGKGLLMVLLGAAGLACAAPTRVQLWFDTEDYTWDRSNDAIRDIANLLTEEGVRGHFNIAGYVARFLMDNHRQDVIDALKPHLIGTQTLYHSLHPNITEATDLEDYDEAYHIALAQESEGNGMLKAVFGRDRILFSCFPGNGSSYVALDVYADQGIPFHGGCGGLYSDRKQGELWYLNQRHLPYEASLHLESFLPGRFEHMDYDRRLTELSRRDMVTLYMHPHMAVRMEHWDKPNYDRGNLVEFGKWKPATPRPVADTELYYSRLRAFIRRLKADPRFEFTDCERLLAEQKPRVPITRADVPKIRTALLKDFGPIDEPASWCVADCFCAAVKFLRGETVHCPGNVHGFLEKPVGVSSPVVVKTTDLKTAAARICLRRYLPAQYDVGGVKLGPADVLFAALEALETGAAEVVVVPRDQLGDIKGKLPGLAGFRHTDSWIYWPEFKDDYLADRLRWQFWTLRYE